MNDHLQSLLRQVERSRSHLVLEPSADELDALEDLLRWNLGLDPVPDAVRQLQKMAREAGNRQMQEHAIAVFNGTPWAR